jgi:hypothetical protein
MMYSLLVLRSTIGGVRRLYGTNHPSAASRCQPQASPDTPRPKPRPVCAIRPERRGDGATQGRELTERKIPFNAGSTYKETFTRHNQKPRESMKAKLAGHTLFNAPGKTGAHPASTQRITIRPVPLLTQRDDPSDHHAAYGITSLRPAPFDKPSAAQLSM